jgi:hypothetical protein
MLYFETIVIDVDDECAFPKKPNKVVDVNYKFQEIWGAKMPWPKPIFNDVRLVFVVRCCVCIKIEMKGKKKVVKQDSIEKCK